MRRMIVIALLTLGVALAACTAEVPKDDGGDQPKRHKAEPAGESGGGGHAHARPTRLGNAGGVYDVTQMGNPTPGAELAFAVTAPDDGTIAADAKLEGWLETDAGEVISARVTAPLAGGAHHLHLTAAKGKAAPAILALRPAGAKQETVHRIALAPGWGPHDGVLAVLRAGQPVVGLLEVKLHDDKGDLEIWLTGADGKPLDLPIDAVAQMTVLDEKRRTIELRVRNPERNEDEDGRANVRDGKTNYFIFPGDTGADASWLKGAEFAADVQVVIRSAGKLLLTLPFPLVPHTHAGGHEHGHGEGGAHEHEHEHEHGEKAPAKKDG